MLVEEIVVYAAIDTTGGQQVLVGEAAADPQLAVVLRRLGQGTDQLVDAFFVALLGLVAVLAAVIGTQLWDRLAAEEERGHAELLLATAVPRTRVAALAADSMKIWIGIALSRRRAIISLRPLAQVVSRVKMMKPAISGNQPPSGTLVRLAAK